MPFIPKVALTLGITTLIGSGVFVEAPTANAQVKIEVNIIESPGVRYRDDWDPYLINYPGYRSYYYRGRGRPNNYLRHRPYRNNSRLRYPVYRRGDYVDRRETRVERRFNTRDFHHRGW